ncbi:MAG: RHS repeat-associated core domain-containing protein [Desulfovibrio sp.]
MFDLPLGFAGGLFDAHTGLIDFGHREYMPDVARWNRPDPLGKAGGDPDVYGYCLDDPMNITDKTGLFLDGMFDSMRGDMRDSAEKYSNTTDSSEDNFAWNDVKSAVGNAATSVKSAYNVADKTLTGLTNALDKAEGEISSIGSEVKYDIPIAAGNALKDAAVGIGKSEPARALLAGAVTLPAAIVGTAAAGPAVVGAISSAAGEASAVASAATLPHLVRGERVLSKAGKYLESKLPAGSKISSYLNKSIGQIGVDAMEFGTAGITGLPPAETKAGQATTIMMEAIYIRCIYYD